MKYIALIISILGGITAAVGFCYRYRTLFRGIGLFATRHFPPAKRLHRYAVLIAARNEETVLDKLIESIRAQDYPAELIDVFVVADNCTDATAEIARRAGAICYERNDPAHRTKGYALQFLVAQIAKDYGVETYDGYFIFDADNLLARDYISRMNDAFDAGEKIVTSYRASKNFSDNWISASYALHWLRTVRNEHRPRSVLRLATRIQGTGFLFANELIRDGWNYTGLTEDRAFCADAVTLGYQISYQNDAIFYDEQPTDLRIAMWQRIRWAKGHLQALAESGGTLLVHIFDTEGKANTGTVGGRGIRLLRNLRLRFMSFDMLTVVFPRTLVTFLKRLLVYALRIVLILGTDSFFGINYAPKLLQRCCSLIGFAPTRETAAGAIALLTLITLAWTADTCLRAILTAAYLFVIERRRIPPIPWYKKLLFCLTFPLFDLIGKYALVIALFTKPEWKPIPHRAAVGIGEIQHDPTQTACRVTENFNCREMCADAAHRKINAVQSLPRVPGPPDPLTRRPDSPSAP